LTGSQQSHSLCEQERFLTDRLTPSPGGPYYPVGQDIGHHSDFLGRQTIADSGGAIESTSHIDFGSTQEIEGDDSKRYRDLLALSRVSAAVSGLWDLDAILEVALDNVLGIMNGSIGGILLLDEETKTLYYRVYRGLSPKYAGEVRLNLGEGIAGRVAQSSKAILLEDISAEPLAAYPDLVQAEDLRAFISVPLRSIEAVLGVINVASHLPHRFTKDDMHLLHSIGDQLGVAIEQAKLYEKLAKGRERYRQLARQVLMAQEEARRRLSRELHDETSQTLAGLALNLQALVDMTEMSNTRDDEFKSRLRKAHSLAVQIGTEVSRIIRELRPTLLDTLGLVPSIRQYAETTFGHLGIMLSQAKNVNIFVECKANDLLLRIIDDGKGFEVSKITGIEQSGRGRGLFSMKERISLLGGTCSVKSRLGEGTIVTAKVPVIRSVADAEDKDIGSR
jgi:signal transduction histidine kinase